MDKNTPNYFIGHPIFSKIISLLDIDSLKGIIKYHGGDYYCKQFTTEQHLITMLYAIFTDCNSI